MFRLGMCVSVFYLSNSIENLKDQEKDLRSMVYDLLGKLKVKLGGTSRRNYVNMRYIIF